MSEPAWMAWLLLQVRGYNNGLCPQVEITQSVLLAPVEENFKELFFPVFLEQVHLFPVNFI
jgi:hypothetical protein